MSQSSTGFTLIELMITVAIVGILAAIAYPSYQNSVQKSWRSNAASCLSELAQRMERRYTTQSRYTFPDSTTQAAFLSGTACTQEGAMPLRYTFTFNGNPDATTFTLQASPASLQANDACGTLAINQMGQKSADGSVSDCWRR